MRIRDAIRATFVGVIRNTVAERISKLPVHLQMSLITFLRYTVSFHELDTLTCERILTELLSNKTTLKMKEAFSRIARGNSNATMNKTIRGIYT